jgi:hypothetical protein
VFFIGKFPFSFGHRGALDFEPGGGVAFLASSTVLCGYWGSGIGRTVRSVGSVMPMTGGVWAEADKPKDVKLVASAAASVSEIRTFITGAPLLEFFRCKILGCDWQLI